MNARRSSFGAAMTAVFLLAGCHHHAAAPVAVLAPPVPVTADGPVMVSVPPPTHRSTDSPEVETKSEIPVVKPVRPPRRRRQDAPPPAVASNNQPTTPAPMPTPAPVTTPAASVATPVTPAQSLGQLTSSTDDPAATRDNAAQSLRRERDRIATIPSSVQAMHPAEMEQARRFLRSASDSLNGSDYVATLALTTKARVLLDDLLK